MFHNMQCYQLHISYREKILKTLMKLSNESLSCKIVKCYIMVITKYYKRFYKGKIISKKEIYFIFERKKAFYNYKWFSFKRNKVSQRSFRIGKYLMKKYMYVLWIESLDAFTHRNPKLPWNNGFYKRRISCNLHDHSPFNCELQPCFYVYICDTLHNAIFNLTSLLLSSLLLSTKSDIKVSLLSNNKISEKNKYENLQNIYVYLIFLFFYTKKSFIT